MRILIQRVTGARVEIKGQVVGQIEQGLLLFVGIGGGDTERDGDVLADKIVKLRIFSDEGGKMNRSVKEVNGHVLSISQFTLYANTRKGNRPSFTEAASPEKGSTLWEYLNGKIETLLGYRIERGRFAEDMKVTLVNDGPVTLMMDSRDVLGSL